LLPRTVAGGRRCENAAMSAVREELLSHVPRLVLGWGDAGEGNAHRRLEGSMAFVDISGFTAMSERLARLGREGAEEVSDIVNAIFARLLAVAYANGGALLKFGGDALLLFFEGPEHAGRAAHAAAGMRRELRQIGRVKTSAGATTLKMHVGVHSGAFDFFLLGPVHRELVVAGPAATKTVEMESSAVAGEIMVSDATADGLPPSVLGERRDGGRLLVRMPPAPLVSVDITVPGDVDPTPFVAPQIQRVAASVVDPEHRRVAISFVRFEGVDAIIERDGVGVAAARLAELMEIVQSAAARNLVTFLDSDPELGGGKFMLAAGAPWGSEHDEEQLLRTAREIVESNPALPVRIGVNEGPVFAGLIGPSYRRKYSIMGDAVNLTARLTAKAEPGQVIAMPDVVERSRTVFSLTELPPFRVKGKTDLVQAFSVGPVVGARDVEDAAQAPLLGRDRELRSLLDAVSSVRSGRGRLIEIVAEPGTGKSRLVHELRWRAGDHRILAATADQYSSSVPYSVVGAFVRQAAGIDPSLSGREAGDALRRAVEAIAPQLAPWLPLIAITIDADVEATPQTERLDDAFKAARLGGAVVDLLRAAFNAPTLLLVEDFHWSDDASATVLQEVARSTRDRPWLLVVTRRPEGRSLLADVPAHGETLELEALPEDASAQLVRTLLGMPISAHDVRKLLERAGGNPLFLQELVAELRNEGTVDTLPTTVEAVIGARIDRLDPGVRTVLRQAAVLGTTLEVELLSELVGGDRPLDAAWLTEALAGFLLPEEGGRMRFQHALIRDAAYEGLPYRRRRELHGRVGEMLESRAAAIEDVAEALSLHFVRARKHDKAWRYSVLAGDRARERFATVAAVEYYERALEAGRALRDLPAEDRRHVGEALGDACERAGMYERAARAYRSARSMITPGTADEARLYMKEGVLRLRMGRYTEALRWHRRGLKVDAATDEAAAIRVELGLAYAGVRYYQGRYRDCVDWCRQMIPVALEIEDLAGLAHAYSLLHLAYTHLGSPERVAYRGLALPLYEKLGDLTRQGHVLNNMGIDSYYDGDWTAAVELYEQGRRALENAGGFVDAADVVYNIAEIVSDQGRLDEAEKLTHEILETYRSARYPVGEALAIANLGRIASRAERFTEAAELLDDARQRFETLGDERFVLEMECRIIELCVFMNAHHEARPRIGQAFTRIRRIGGVPALLCLVHRLHGYALAQAGDVREARAEIERSIEVARAANIRYEIALSLEALARLTDDEARADAAREESQAIFDRLGVVSTPNVPLPPIEASQRIGR
jgi:class 3 adenylate cyclase/tetratricopeptide (TPR) repeat protein